MTNLSVRLLGTRLTSGFSEFGNCRTGVHTVSKKFVRTRGATGCREE